MKKILIGVVIVALLGAVVGYLALDRHDKSVERQKEQGFRNKYNK